MHIVTETNITITNYNEDTDRDVILANPALPVQINPPLDPSELGQFGRAFSTVVQEFPMHRQLPGGATIVKMVPHVLQTLLPVPV